MEYKCSNCGQTKDTREELQVHEQTCGGQSEVDAVPKTPIDQPHRCGICHKTLATRALYDQHLMKVHHLKKHQREDGKFVCPHCGREFENALGVAIHIARGHKLVCDAKATATEELPAFKMDASAVSVKNRTLSFLEGDEKDLLKQIRELEEQKVAIDAQIAILRIKRDYNRHIQVNTKGGK